MNWPDWPEVLLAIGFTLVGLIGIVLTVITLPGIWLPIAAALLVKLLRPETFDWTVIFVCIGLALLGELIEFIAGAAGAAKAGGSKRGALGAGVGSLVGAILGAPLLFPLGSIAGGVLGAGVGALLIERAWVKKSWDQSAKIGAGAAIGRMIATVVKTTLAGTIAMLLVIATVR
ncbi:MAG: DUF456 domain-containing protein [Planctomycetota bacterium]|nr:DUF456 domain-containing protein [Planctomycetota bacterium]